MIVRKSAIDPVDFDGLTIYDYTAKSTLSSSLAYIDVPPDGRHPVAWSEESDKYYLVVRGQIEFRIGDVTETLSAGDFCFIKQGERFSYANRTTGPAAVVLVHTPRFNLAAERFEAQDH